MSMSLLEPAQCMMSISDMLASRPCISLVQHREIQPFSNTASASLFICARVASRIAFAAKFCQTQQFTRCNDQQALQTRCNCKILLPNVSRSGVTITYLHSSARELASTCSNAQQALQTRYNCKILHMRSLATVGQTKPVA